MYVFFSVFEKVKKYIFAHNFLKKGSMELKICAKKTCNRSGSSPEILSKSVRFSKIYDILKVAHFHFDLTVRVKLIIESRMYHKLQGLQHEDLLSKYPYPDLQTE